MHFHTVLIAAILVLVGAGEAAAIAPRGHHGDGGGGGYNCISCSGEELNLICLGCVAIEL